jgi:hypothetical protein
LNYLDRNVLTGFGDQLVLEMLAVLFSSSPNFPYRCFASQRYQRLSYTSDIWNVVSIVSVEY